MTKPKATTQKVAKQKSIESYQHADKKRVNNPPAGLVTPRTDPDAGGKKTYAYDPHLDPQLHWAGKAERTSFEVPTVSLHVHERIDSRTIVDAVRKRNGNGANAQMPLFQEERSAPLRQAIEFYKHAHNWSNRLIAGDSLLVMNSLLQKENMAGKVQCVYMDPPYGIKYGSNFQPFTNKRDVKDGKDEDLTAEPEQIRAFRDTWELGIHSYLSYMRDRLLLAKELLTESGSVFVQISDKNVHHIREIMDEVFGAENFVSLIYFATTSGFSSSEISRVGDYLCWYAKNKDSIKYRPLFQYKEGLGRGDAAYRHIELPDGTLRSMTKHEREGNQSLPKGSRIFQYGDSQSQGASSQDTPFEFEGKTFKPLSNSHWKAKWPDGMNNLKKANRLAVAGTKLRYVRYMDDYPVQKITNSWMDTGFAGFVSDKRYVVETNTKVIQRCILMATDPGDLVFDPTCGSGTTAFVAEQWGRRWITCDTSRVAITLAKQRLMTATFDYYKLAHPDEGVGSGFQYKTVPHITLKSIANDEPPATETLYDQPLKDTKRARVTGPFTYEAVPSPTVQPIDTPPAPAGRGIEGEGLNDPPPNPPDNSITRSGETLRQHEWRDELLKTGIRGKGGQRISFSRVESLPYRWLHADAETKPDDSGKDQVKDAAKTAYKPTRAVVSFGPEHAPLEQRQVENALQEAATLKPSPKIIVFAAFQFDPEAAKDIEKTKWPGVTLLKVQMNTDMQTEDLKKKRTSNESFWLIGQPDIEAEPIADGEGAATHRVIVRGFDYFNTKTGDVESGNADKIAVWMLDTDYDGRSLYPSQVFFPMTDHKSGWTRLAKNLKAEIDEDLIEAYRGTTSLPFKIGKNSRVAVKIVDDRGVESLRVVGVE